MTIHTVGLKQIFEGGDVRYSRGHGIDTFLF